MNKFLTAVTSAFITCAIMIPLYSFWQVKQADPILTFRLTLPQASSVIYALRNSTILDAQTANGLADLLVTQANDSTLQKAPLSQSNKPKGKK